jgi:hypothetical protein
MVTAPGDEAERSRCYAQGLEYLHAMQELALDPAMIGGLQGPLHPAIASWVGAHYPDWNAQLQSLLQACQECFHPHARPSVQVFAVPLAAAFGLDGLCNHRTVPMTILVDLGRVVPTHWLRLVAHEYAHALVGKPGHDAAFVQALAQLCLGLGLEAPPPDAARWNHWPPCSLAPDPLVFWRGPSVTFVTDH